MKTFYVLAALLLTVTGCTKQDKGIEGTLSRLVLSGQVTFSDNDDAGASSSSVAAAKPLETRAGGQLPVNTNLGVYILKTPATPGSANVNYAEWKNLPFVCTSNGQITLTGGTGVVLTSGTKYDIFAYAPQVQNVADAKRIPVSHGTDILWGKKTVDAVPGTTRVNLEFRHAGSQIGFKLKPKDGVTMDLTLAKMTVTGFYKTGTLDLETGKITGADPTEKLTDKTGAKSYVLATGEEMTVNVIVTDIPGQELPFTGSCKLTLKPGKPYLYNITLNPNGAAQVKFDPVVVDWEDVEADNDLIIK